MSRKILNKYTTIGDKKISELFSKNPKTYLVTDKITNFLAINEQLKIPQDRLLVEVFSYAKYTEALENGIKYPILCVWDYKGLMKYMDLLMNEKVSIITMSKQDLHLSKEHLKRLRSKSIAIFVFTENDPSIILEHAPMYVTGFYTDVANNSSIIELVKARLFKTHAPRTNIYDLDYFLGIAGNTKNRNWGLTDQRLYSFQKKSF